MTDHPEGWDFPFTPVELRQLWTYSDGSRTVKAYWAVRTGHWVLVDPASGKADATAPAGDFSRRFRPVDEFADVTGFSTYLRTVHAPDGTPLVDLILDRNPFMLANGPQHVARPHVLMVPRRHRDGWSSATPPELAARDAAMTLVAAWYGSLDGGHAVFAANDSAPNLDYQRDMAAAHGTVAEPGAGAPVTRNPRQEVQHAHLHAFYAEDSATVNSESAGLAEGYRAFGDTLSADAVPVEKDQAADVRAAARPWGGSYCSYQLGPGGGYWVMPALGRSQDEFNQRLAWADGLEAGPDPRLGGAVNLVRPGLDDPGRRQAAEQAAERLKESFEAFAAGQAGR